MTQPETSFSGPEVCALSAQEVVGLLRRGEVSPAELVEASAARIAEVEPAVNAVVIPCIERARAAAKSLPEAQDNAGWLGGLPIGIKDLSDVSGVRTTMGNPALAQNVAEKSDGLVLQLEARGGIVMGKTNTPEMGAGGNTFNDVFGATRNPWDTRKNAGGSSGGAAVSLATGEVWLSHGSDLAGSLRTPASYCSVVGFRPSPGVVGGGPASQRFANEGAQGVMARNIGDTALFLDAAAGLDPSQPLSYPAPVAPYQDAVTRATSKVRIAYSGTLGGFAPVNAEVDSILQSALGETAKNGASVEDACPELPALRETYLTFRAMFWAAVPGRAPAEVQAHFKPTLQHNIAQGRALTNEQIYDALAARSQLYDNMAAFLQRHDVLACPAIGVPPGPVEEEFPREVEGDPMTDYVNWLRFSFLAVITTLPSLSMPVGFTKSGLPVGLQLIGPPRGEAKLLAVARAVEQAVGLSLSPIDPIVRH